MLLFFLLFFRQGLTVRAGLKLSCVAKESLELLLLPLTPECWDYKHVPPGLVSVGLGSDLVHARQAQGSKSSLV